MRAPNPGRLRPLLAVLALLLALPAAAQESTAALRVVVTDAATGEPVREARLRLRGTRVAGEADAEGRVLLRNLAPGAVTVDVSRLGYTAAELPVTLAPGGRHELAVELRADPVALEELTAQARTKEAWTRQHLESRGFFERRSTGQGVFMLREDIMRNNPRTMTQILGRHRRLKLSEDAWSTAPAPASRRGRPMPSALNGCRPAFFLDGVLVEGFDVNSIEPDNVEAVEIYRGSSELPPDFNRGTSGCGAVVIWSRVN